MPDKQLKDRIAVVTGAASGIGAAIVARFAASGAKVIGLDLAAAPGIIAADLGDDRAFALAADQIERDMGSADIVVHAAAVSVFGGVLDTPPDQFATLYNVNVIGAVRLLRRFAPAMIERGNGAFLCFSSINAHFATPTLAAYAATKAALNNLVQTAALELAPHSIRVNAIAPASIDTPLLRQSFARDADPEAARARNVARHPLGRLGTSGEVAELALFLCSERAGWITGTVSPIDGGAGVTRR